MSLLARFKCMVGPLAPLFLVLSVLVSDPSRAQAECSNRLESIYAARLERYDDRERELHEKRQEELKQDFQRKKNTSAWSRCYDTVTGFFTNTVPSEFHEIEYKLQRQHEVACVRAAQKQFGINRYVACKRPSDMISDGRGHFYLADPPCQTKTYGELNAYLFKKSAECVGLPAGGLFRFETQESGLNPDIVSGTGCIGPGQMTADLTTTVWNYDHRSDEIKKGAPEPFASIDSALEKVNDRIKNNPNCAAFRNVNNYYKDPKQKCNYLHRSVNPEVGFLIAAKAYLVNRIQVGLMLEQWMEKYSRIRNLEPNELSRLKSGLTTISHNAGLPGTMAQFALFLKDSKRPRLSDDADDILQNFSKYLKVHYPSKRKSRREEVASYYPQARRRTLSIEDSVRGKCFR